MPLKFYVVSNTATKLRQICLPSFVDDITVFKTPVSSTVMCVCFLNIQVKSLTHSGSALSISIAKGLWSIF